MEDSDGQEAAAGRPAAASLVRVGLRAAILGREAAPVEGGPAPLVERGGLPPIDQRRLTLTASVMLEVVTPPTASRNQPWKLAGDLRASV